MKRSNLYRVFMTLAGFLLITGCGGLSSGSDAATATRALTGSVGSASPSLTGGSLALTSGSSCYADTVMATDTNASTVSSEVADDCSFTLDLQVNKSYIISFLLNDSFVASLIFDSGVSGFSGTSLPITDGTTSIDMGSITISGSVATPENEPLDQMDCDDDGTSDLDDTDDDGDSIDDDQEEDCDLDGVIDDWDDSKDDAACDETLQDQTARVFEVKPRNDPQPEHGNDRIDLDKEIRARIGCVIDQSSVTAETFRVEAADDTSLTCDYAFSDDGESEAHETVKCLHASEDFTANTIYTITIDGVMCEDGRSVESRSWTFLTATSDDSQDNSEDDLDNADEHED